MARVGARLAPDATACHSCGLMTQIRHHLEKNGNAKRVFVLGATGTIGRAAVRALVRNGHQVVCLIRQQSSVSDQETGESNPLQGAEIRYGDVTNARSLHADGFRGESFDVLLSCLASRTGVPKDAWAIDHDAHCSALAAARDAGIDHIILLSAICVQKPALAFQQAKLAFENVLIGSGLRYSIVRPTAFFKSLSGQVERVRRGQRFLLFGDGKLTACKPISDDDLGRYLASCIDDDSCYNKILPIGGPGPAMTPKQQGEQLFALLNREPRFRHVPVRLLDGIIGLLTILGRLLPAMSDKAELARIGRYYATESMLVWNPDAGTYDAEATPSFGTETLADYHARLITGETRAERGDHAVF